MPCSGGALRTIPFPTHRCGSPDHNFALFPDPAADASRETVPPRRLLFHAPAYFSPDAADGCVRERPRKVSAQFSRGDFFSRHACVRAGDLRGERPGRCDP